MEKILQTFSDGHSYFVNAIRISVFIVMAWIGGLKAFQYEADEIVPFVANSPLMSFFYSKDAPEYQGYKNPEGRTVQKNIDWHTENNTYTFTYALGTVILAIGVLTLAGIWSAKAGFLGGLLTFMMSLVTLSFLITTPEVYVPALGGDFPTPQHGFPYLSGAGRLVLKDIIMMASGLLLASDSAGGILRGKGPLIPGTAASFPVSSWLQREADCGFMWMVLFLTISNGTSAGLSAFLGRFQKNTMESIRIPQKTGYMTLILLPLQKN